MTDALFHLEKARNGLKITHQTGESDFANIRELYDRSEFKDADVRPFISDMHVEFGKADLVICRAGATTCAELAAAGKASIMVPLPSAADDHQRKNAEAFVNSGAAKMLVQADLGGERLAKKILELVASPDRIDEMEEAARKLGRKDAAKAAVNLIEELAGNLPQGHRGIEN
jgi:UDP-N-acetylglucosamine--N-acetylmuramyl-(pentapeptide) pyrophosphoryl-undecaprenol N-acetylglucosamine transferase